MSIEREAKEQYPFGQVDHKAWAKMIMERERRGDKTLLMIQVQFAKQALGIADKPA